MSSWTDSVPPPVAPPGPVDRGPVEPIPPTESPGSALHPASPTTTIVLTTTMNDANDVNDANDANDATHALLIGGER
jgi:hypothetical protein